MPGMLGSVNRGLLNFSEFRKRFFWNPRGIRVTAPFAAALDVGRMMIEQQTRVV
jgi:hypothetical protein